MFTTLILLSLSLAQYTTSQTTYTLGNLPNQSQQGQAGTNQCGTVASQNATCQNAFINSLQDFCLWAPPLPNSQIGQTEEEEVSWCLKNGYGTRLIPAGTITGAHFLKTPHYTQITGIGNFVNMNVQAGDSGGELDPHGATGNGNPIGSLVFSNGTQVHEWTSFMSDSQFCFRICPDGPPDAALWCAHQYDLQGCDWNEPGNYNPGFDQCDGDSTVSPPGLYIDGSGATSSFEQGNGNPPPTPHPAGASSNCVTFASLTYAGGVVTTASTTTTAARTPAPTTAPTQTGKPTSTASATSTAGSNKATSGAQTSRINLLGAAVGVGVMVVLGWILE